MGEGICSFGGCERVARKTSGLCKMHRQQMWRTGRLRPIRQRFGTLGERFWSKVAPAAVDDCWMWIAGRDSQGYGRFGLSSAERSYLAHRVAYELLIGPVPAGLELDHLCRNRACVNPWHLDPVTPRVNLQRAIGGVGVVNGRKTHCPRGHAYDEANTRIRKRRRGVVSRVCRACHREDERQRQRHTENRVK